MFDRFVMDGSVTLVAIAVLAIEGAVLFVIARSRRRFRTSAVVANLLSGLCLILALRAALVGDGATMIALWLGLGGLAHLGDLVLRLRR
jgi:hypothetical protein